MAAAALLAGVHGLSPSLIDSGTRSPRASLTALAKAFSPSIFSLNLISLPSTVRTPTVATSSYLQGMVVVYLGKDVGINYVVTVVLMDDGSIAAIPDARFVREVSVNRTSVASQRISIPVSIPSRVSFPKAEAELLKLVYSYRSRLDQRFPPIFTVKNRGPNSVEDELDLLASDPELPKPSQPCCPLRSRNF